MKRLSTLILLKKCLVLTIYSNISIKKNTIWNNQIKKQMFWATHRIHLIFMRIRILDPHWKKNRSGSESGSRLWLIKFFTKQKFPIFSLMLKPDEPFRNQEIFIITLFSKVQIWVLRVNYFFAVFGWYFAPWIRIQEAKILRIKRIRILSTACHCINRGSLEITITVP